MSDPRPDDLPETVLASGQPAPVEPGPSSRVPSRSGQRRSQIRWRCGFDAVCQLDGNPGDTDWWPAKVENVSTVGLCLILNRQVEPHSLLVIEPRIPARPASPRLIARVVNARPARDGAWALGCELTAPLTDTQLRGLLL